MLAGHCKRLQQLVIKGVTRFLNAKFIPYLIELHGKLFSIFWGDSLSPRIVNTRNVWGSSLWTSTNFL